VAHEPQAEVISIMPDVPGAGGEEAKRIHELVRKSAEPEGFRAFELRFGDDSTGDPAVWVWFTIDPHYPTTKESIRTLTRVRRRVITALLDDGISRNPYVRFREKQDAAG
jgi:hypothetical protein